MIYPEHINFNNWASSLIIDFPDVFIPNPPEEENWKKWARLVCEQDGFSGSDTINPNLYENWRKWAISLYKFTQ